jgi:ATP-binding cassette subfamily C protein
MRREIRFGAAALRRRPTLALAGWSALELPSSALSGLAVARALDSGFLRHRVDVGLAWIAGLLVASVLGAVAARHIFRSLGDLVEPLRDDLVRRVVTGALRRAADGRDGRDDGATARLTRQVEAVRDSFAGLIVAVRGFAVATIGATVGMLALDPVTALFLLPPFLLGFAAFAATLDLAAAKQRTAVLADERVAATAATALAARRDIAACGAERYAADLVAGPVEAQAHAERALAGVSALQSLCFAVGGWLPLVVLLAAAPTLIRHGLTPGTMIGALIYVLSGLQPALRAVMAGLGGSGVRYTVTLGRILDASAFDGPTQASDQARKTAVKEPADHRLTLRGVTFAYGPASEPVLRDLDLTVPEGDHLAVIGPSGIGKSTLAALICGLRHPDRGRVELGGVPVADLTPEALASARVLIPQEAYVFAGTVRDNVAYLRPGATDLQINAAAVVLGAGPLLNRLDGVVIPGELSAGERQMLALIRAYLSPALVVVLDEATCHLDPAAERRCEEAFARRGGTLIVIAHRLSSALRARRVLVLDGADAAVGDHERLLADSPLYRELLGVWADRSDPALVAGDPGRLDASAAAGLGDGAGQVVANGPGAQEQRGGDRLGGRALDGHAQHLPLALGERVVLGGQRSDGQVDVQDRLAEDEPPDAVQELAR